MAKRKVTKKVENIEKEAVEEVLNSNSEINEKEVSELLNETVEEKIDMNEISEFVNEEEKPKEVNKTNNISHKFTEMFGFIWNGQEYDY